MKRTLLNVSFVGILVAALTGSALLLASGHGGGHCPFVPDEGKPCPMSLSAHVTKWQEMASGLPSENASLMGLAIVVAIGIIAIEKKRLINLETTREFGRIRAPCNILLARGIMHGKNP